MDELITLYENIKEKLACATDANSNEKLFYGKLKHYFARKFQNDGLLLSDIERMKELKERFESTDQEMKDIIKECENLPCLLLADIERIKQLKERFESTNQEMKDIIKECENLPCTDPQEDTGAPPSDTAGMDELITLYEDIKQKLASTMGANSNEKKFYGKLKHYFARKLQNDGLLLADIERIKELKEIFESTNQKMKDIIKECENLPCTESSLYRMILWWVRQQCVAVGYCTSKKVMYQFTVHYDSHFMKNGGMIIILLSLSLEY